MKQPSHSMRSKLFAGVTTFGIVSIALVGCSATDPTASGSESAKDTITLGHAGAPDSLQNKAALQIKERVEELTDGAVTVEVYPASQLGSWEEQQGSIEVGAQDALIESPGSLERYTDLAAVGVLPYLYANQDEFFEVWDGDLGADIIDQISEESGFRLLGSFYRGPWLTATNKLIESPSDLAGVKIRVPNQASVIATWEVFGASPTPMALNEVFSALEQGAIDGVENPIDIHRYNSFYEVVPNIAETHHMYGNYHIQVWDEAYQAWPDNVRDAFDQAVEEASLSYREASIADAIESKKVMIEGGATFTEVDFDEWAAAAAPAYEKFPEAVQEWAAKVRESYGR